MTPCMTSKVVFQKCDVPFMSSFFSFSHALISSLRDISLGALDFSGSDFFFLFFLQLLLFLFLAIAAFIPEVLKSDIPRTPRRCVIRKLVTYLIPQIPRNSIPVKKPYAESVTRQTFLNRR